MLDLQLIEVGKINLTRFYIFNKLKIFYFPHSKDIKAVQHEHKNRSGWSQAQYVYGG